MVLRKEIALQIKNLLKENPQGLSITDIVNEVRINRNTAGRYLENLLVSGQVEMRRLGMAKIYILSQRVPFSALLSISSELVIQMDNNLRIIFANEPFLKLIGTDSKNLLGKNIEYTPVPLVFDESFTGFIENIRAGIAGKEWVGEIILSTKDIILFCRIAPTVFEDGRKGVSVIFEDITQRKHAERKIEESERQFRLLAENSIDIISRLKPDGTRIYVSPAYKTTLGYEPEELIGKRGQELIHPDDVHILASLHNALTPQNSTGTIVFRTKHKNGHYVWIESTIRAIFDENTLELSEYYGVTRDITERKIAERSLHDSEERYRTLVDISPDAVIIHRNGKILFMNPAALTLIGASQFDEMLGKNILEFIQPEFRDEVMENIQKDLKGEISPLIELHMLRLDGSSIIVEGRGVKTTIDGKPAIQVAIRDITERKRAEEELRESEEKYRSFIERANDGIVVVQDGILKMSNMAITEFWGGSIEQILGKNFTDFIHPDALPEVVNRYNQRMAGESPPSIYETILMRKDGSRFFAELNAGIIAYDGKPADLIIIRDMNERKKIEAALRESEEKYRTLINQANDVISIVQDGVIKMCNPRLAEFWGGSIEEILGKPFTDFIHPEALPEVVNRYNQRMAGESPPSMYETIFMRKDGSKSYVELNAGIVSYEGKNADLVIVRDVNERRKIEIALRESEATARALMNAPTDSVILTDIQGKILALNETAALRLGKRSDEIIGMLVDDLLPKEILKTRKTLIDQVIENKTMVRFVDQRDGIWYDTVAYPIVNESGDVKKIAIIARDITEQKNTEKQLRESQQKFLRFLEQSFDVIAIHKEGKIVFLNDRAAKILGAATPLDLIGRSIFDFIHPDSLRDMEDHLQKLSADLGLLVPVLTEKFLRVDGTIAITEVMAIRFYENLFIRFG